MMREKMYKVFKAKEISGSSNYKTGYGGPSPTKAAVVTDDKDEFVIAIMPDHLKYPMTVAKAIAETLTKSKLVLTDLI